MAPKPRSALSSTVLYIPVLYMTNDQLQDPSSTKPYLIRAICQWSIDNDLTPQILVDATYPGVEVPEAYVQQGRIILNIHNRAVDGINLGNDEIIFSTRFGGVARQVFVPVPAVLAIFARENNQGIYFQIDETQPPGDDAGDGSNSKPGASKKPNLKLVQ